MGNEEKRKIGVRVDGNTYDNFVDYVEEKYGRKDGVLAVEVEQALRRQMNAPDAEQALQTVSERLEDIYQHVADADGGATVSGRTHTQETKDVHTQDKRAEDGDSKDEPNQSVTKEPEKPAPKSSTGNKVDYLTETFVDRDFEDPGTGEYVVGGAFKKDRLKSHIRDKYSFEDRTVDKYAELVVEKIGDRYGVGVHPKNRDVIIYGANIEKVKQENEGDGA